MCYYYSYTVLWKLTFTTYFLKYIAYIYTTHKVAPAGGRWGGGRVCFGFTGTAVPDYQTFYISGPEKINKYLYFMELPH